MELQEVKSALDEAGRLYKGQFEHINGKIAALEAKGAAVDPLLLETREKLNKAIDEAAQKNETFIALQASVNKLEKLGVHVGDGKSRDFDGEAKSFSIERNSIAQAKGIPSPAASVSVDEYRAYTKAFDRYLDTTTFDSKQIQFVNQVIDYLTQNGVMDPKMLFEHPFTNLSPGGPTSLFKDDDATKIVGIIRAINTNAAVG